MSKLHRCTGCNVTIANPDETICDVCFVPAQLKDHEERDPVTGEIYVTSPAPPLSETITALVLAWPIFMIAISLALSIRF